MPHQISLQFNRFYRHQITVKHTKNPLFIKIQQEKKTKLIEIDIQDIRIYIQTLFVYLCTLLSLYTHTLLRLQHQNKL